MTSARLLALVLVVPAAAGCSRRSGKGLVEGVEVVELEADAAAQMKLTTGKLKELFLERLRADGSFVFTESGQRAPEGAAAARLRLGLGDVRRVEAGAGESGRVDVRAALSVNLRGATDGGPYSLRASGSAPVDGDAAALEAAQQKALVLALDRLVKEARALLRAVGKPDAELVAALGSRQMEERAAALRILTERKNPNAISALIGKLKSEDLDEVRGAMGGLVELKASQAVPDLIEIARGVDAGFLREIVFALGEIGGEEAEAFLYTVEQGHDNELIRRAASDALRDLREGDEKLKATAGRTHAGNKSEERSK